MWLLLSTYEALHNIEPGKEANKTAAFLICLNVAFWGYLVGFCKYCTIRNHVVSSHSCLFVLLYTVFLHVVRNEILSFIFVHLADGLSFSILIPIHFWQTKMLYILYNILIHGFRILRRIFLTKIISFHHRKGRNNKFIMPV